MSYFTLSLFTKKVEDINIFVEYYHAKCNEIFCKVHLCTVLKYGVSIMKPEITNL